MLEEILKLYTQKGYDALEEEREYLVNVKQKEVAERLKEAISYGDLSENAEYDAAKDEQAEIEHRLAEIDERLKVAKIVKMDDVTGDKVTVGVVVDLKNVETGEVESFEVVGMTESDPFEEPPRISPESELTQTLYDKKVGDIVDLKVPSGTFKYEVVNIAKQDM